MATDVQDVGDSKPNPVSQRFVHLHLHTEYSLLDGGNRIDALIRRVKELGMDAVAVTDHGNLHGAVEFYNRARAEGIKPILGIEAYVAPADRTLKQQTGLADGGFHLVLLAENNTGWENLIRLSSDSFVNGFYYKPRMDKITLAQWSQGLIAINGHMGSSLAHHLTLYAQTSNESHYTNAVEEAQWHKQTFNDSSSGQPCFFIELQRTGKSEQDRINPLLIRLAKDIDAPLVVDNDAHYLRAEDADTHDTLCCISMGKTKDDQSRLHYSQEIYVKSPQQMAELFHDVPEAVENTVRIANRCHVDLSFNTSRVPLVRVEKKSDPPEFSGSSATEWFKRVCEAFELRPVESADVLHESAVVSEECNDALRHLCEAGLIWRYGLDGATDEIRQRLNRELQILADKNISAYFLIVWDFVNWARQRGIPAMARGSGVGTMVGYCLGLSNACPQRYGLLFERFTDPDRGEYPDIDIDICQDGRADVINYVRQKYGHVAQIITFGRLKARAAIKDVARVHGLMPAEAQRLANLVPTELNITIDAAIQKEPDFKQEYQSNAMSRKVIDAARALEDHARHSGVHAAGVVIATEPLDTIVPLGRASGSEEIVTQWDGPTCERVGLLKMDFLGLRTLSTVELACTLIRSGLPEQAIWNAVGRSQDNGGPHPLDLERLPYDDQRVFELFRRADTAGVFQFESGGMRRLLQDMKPDRIEDLIAANALFRPGPMELIGEYCRRKHGASRVPRIHEIVDKFTSETYGIMVYQEQVMQIVHELGDIPLRAAYTLIKAISKKKHSVIDAQRPRFIQGSRQKGLSETQANELFDLILKFAGYGFNKSHSTGYAIIAYQTAYLKTFFPNQYMAALLSYESRARKVDDWVPLLEECKRVVFPQHDSQEPRVGVEVRPPDVNLSLTDFAVVFGNDEPHDALHGHVRFGLSAVKGLGRTTIDAIVKERSGTGAFKSLHDFCERVGTQIINKAGIETLVKCGAFDSIHSPDKRAAMVSAVDDAISVGQQLAHDRRMGQMNFLMDMASTTAPSDDATHRVLPNVQPWDTLTMLTREKECLGFHVSGHPLDQHEQTLATYCTAAVADASQLSHDTGIVLGGLLTRVRPSFVQKGPNAGEKMAMITVSDKTGSMDGVIFSGGYSKFGSLLTEHAIVVLAGRVDRQRGEPQIIVDQVFDITDAARHLTGRIEIDLPEESGLDSVDARMECLHSLLSRNGSGNASSVGRAAEVFVGIPADGQRYLLRLNRAKLIAENSVIKELHRSMGCDHVRLISCGVPKRVDRRANGARRAPTNVSRPMAVV